MTREQAIRTGYEIKKEIVDILKQHYHKRESLEQNLKKYNNLFCIPVSDKDLEYIIKTDILDLDMIISVNEYINNILRTSKYGSYYGPDIFKSKNI